MVLNWVNWGVSTIILYKLKRKLPEIVGNFSKIYFCMVLNGNKGELGTIVLKP